MRDIWGLIVALTGLFIVWLWATGRITQTWAAIVGGSVPGSAGDNAATFNPSSVKLNLGNVGSSMAGMDFRPATYIPTPKITVGNLSMGSM